MKKMTNTSEKGEKINFSILRSMKTSDNEDH